MNNIKSNFFQITFNSNKFNLKRVEYKTELLNELRKKYNKSHSFFRNENWIYISQMTDEEINIGSKIEFDVNDKNNELLISSLIKHIFFRKFIEKYPNKIPQSFYPFSILSTKNEDNLIFNFLPENLKTFISFKKQVEIQFRTIKPEDNLVFFGALINNYYKWTFSINCQQLINEQFDIIGLNVIHSEMIEGLQNLLAPIETLIGNVISIHGNEALIETNEGKKKYDLDSLFLQKTKTNIGKYLSFKMGDYKAKQVFDYLKKSNIERFDGKEIYNKISSVIKSICDLNFSNKMGFSFKINKESYLPDKIIPINKPTFIFDYTPGKTHKIADFGLNEYGPYDSNTFNPKNIKILILFHKDNRGYFSEFAGKLKNGIHKTDYVKYFAQGFKDKYRLHNIEIILEQIDNYSLDSFTNKLSELIDTHSDNLFNLAIIETKDEFKKLEIKENPYFKVKAQLMAVGIPVQLIKASNIKKDDYELQFILNTMCLQIYAKLGGTPWILPAYKGVDREIIVGIGNSIIRNNWYSNNEQSRIVGITTFFSSDGQYLMGIKCKDVPYENYFDELMKSLKLSINSISEEYGWQKEDTVRIIFHIFKPIKNIEADVVNKLISTFSDYKIDYAFITIKQNHPFLIFDLGQSGLPETKNGKLKGVYSPQRGLTRVLDSTKNEKSCLIQMLGAKEIKTAYHGFSKPLLITIDSNSSYQDLDFITKQIFDFTYLSWRTFLEAENPVTIYYSTLIAKMLGKLRLLEEWNPDIINAQFKYKKWFL